MLSRIFLAVAGMSANAGLLVLAILAVLLCAALAMTFLTEPKPARTGVSPETASGQTDPARQRQKA